MRSRLQYRVEMSWVGGNADDATQRTICQLIVHWFAINSVSVLIAMAHNSRIEPIGLCNMTLGTC